MEAFSRHASINGVSVLLSPQQAQNFTLALHELATNSAKYGALSKITGKVEASWTIEPGQSDSVLKFRWQESGGPPVKPPAYQGFGTQLLKAVFSDVRLEYPAEGLRCEIEVPLISTKQPSPLSQAEEGDTAVVDG
jgi:two-component system, chemotaxis family, CheB/CheR fusion protein